MKPFNWTDCEHPCFDGYEFSFGEDDGPDDCDASDEKDCAWKVRGCGWHDCEDGALSHWCDWLPKEAKNAG